MSVWGTHVHVPEVVYTHPEESLGPVGDSLGPSPGRSVRPDYPSKTGGDPPTSQ